MLIDRMRRGTHDRADTTGPCRGCATAVSCRAASRTSRRACPCPVLLCTPHIKLAEPRYMCLDSCSRGRPRTSRRPRVSGDAGHTQITATSCKRKPFGAVTSIRSQRLPRQRTHVCHRRRLSRRKPAAAGGTRASRMDSTRKMQLACSQAHPNRPAEAALSSSRA